MQSGLIHHRCTAPAHQRAVAARVADTLTIVEGQWGYCSYDVNAKDHRWERTGGVPIEQLRRGTPQISLGLDVRPRPAAPVAVAHAPSRKSPPRSKRTA
jgi:hypothetical protein